MVFFRIVGRAWLGLWCSTSGEEKASSAQTDYDLVRDLVIVAWCMRIIDSREQRDWIA